MTREEEWHIDDEGRILNSRDETPNEIRSFPYREYIPLIGFYIRHKRDIMEIMRNSVNHEGSNFNVLEETIFTCYHFASLSLVIGGIEYLF